MITRSSFRDFGNFIMLVPILLSIKYSVDSLGSPSIESNNLIQDSRENFTELIRSICNLSFSERLKSTCPTLSNTRLKEERFGNAEIAPKKCFHDYLDIRTSVKYTLSRPLLFSSFSIASSTSILARCKTSRDKIFERSAKRCLHVS